MRKLTDSRLNMLWSRLIEGNDYQLIGNTKDSKKITDARKKAAKEIESGKDIKSINVNTGKIKYKELSEDKVNSPEEKSEMKKLGMSPVEYKQLKAFDKPKQDYMVRNHPDYKRKGNKTESLEESVEDSNRDKIIDFIVAELTSLYGKQHAHSMYMKYEDMSNEELQKYLDIEYPMGWEKYIDNSLTESSEYETFFRNALKKFNVSEPDQLEDGKKREFYNYIDSNWKSKKELTENSRERINFNTFAELITKTGNGVRLIDGDRYEMTGIKKRSKDIIFSANGGNNYGTISKNGEFYKEGDKLIKILSDGEETIYMVENKKKGKASMLKEAKYNLRIDGEISTDSSDDMMRILQLAGLSDTSMNYAPMDTNGDDMNYAPMDTEMDDEEFVSDMNTEIDDGEISNEPNILMSSKKYDAVDNMRSIMDSLNEAKETNLGDDTIYVSMELEDGFDETDLKKAEDYFNSQVGHIYSASRNSLDGNKVSYTLNKISGWNWSFGADSDAAYTNITVKKFVDYISYFINVKKDATRYTTAK